MIRQAIYTFELNSNPGQFIAVKHGETGYYKTTVYDQGHADVLNSRQSLTPADCEAAESCSMFNTWVDFEGIKASLIEHGVSDKIAIEGA